MEGRKKSGRLPAKPAVDDGQLVAKLSGEERVALQRIQRGLLLLPDLAVSQSVSVSKTGVRSWTLATIQGPASIIDLGSLVATFPFSQEELDEFLQANDVEGYLRYVLEAADGGEVQLELGAPDEAAADDDVPSDVLQLSAFLALLQLRVSSGESRRGVYREKTFPSFVAKVRRTCFS